MKKKSKKYPQKATKIFSIKDFQKGIDLETSENLTDINLAKVMYNFDTKSKALKPSKGISELQLPVYNYTDKTQEKIVYIPSRKVKDFWLLKMFNNVLKERADKLILRLDNNALYYCRLFDVHILSSINSTLSGDFNTFNCLYSNNDSIVFSKTDASYKFDAVTPLAEIEDSDYYSNFAYHKGYMIAVVGDKRNTIKFLQGNDFADFVTSNSLAEIVIDDMGRINKISNFRNNLLIFHDYGISALTFYSNGEYAVTKLFVSGSKIYPETICESGDKIIFLTREGVYTFDGSKATKLKTGINNYFKNVINENSVGAYHKGKYYFACRIDFGDNKKIGTENEVGYINNVLISIDIENDNIEIIRGIDIKKMLTVQLDSVDKVILSFNGENSNILGEIDDSGKILGKDYERFYQTPTTDLGYSEYEKILKWISLYTTNDIVLTIVTENGNKDYSISGSKLATKLNLNIVGKVIGFKISTTGSCDISNIRFGVQLKNIV